VRFSFVRSYLFTEPQVRLQHRVGDDAEAFLAEIEEWLAQGRYLAGWFGYEFGSRLEERLAGRGGKACRRGQLLADLGVYGPPLVFDHRSGQGRLPEAKAGSLAAGWDMRDLRPNVDHRTYLQAIDRLKEYIAAGDTYQVNYTLKLLFSWTGSPEALYLDLRHNQTVPYGAYMRSGAERILSFSPELFFRRDTRGLVVRPMKGTSRRGESPEEDRLLREGLSRDEKNMSENVMIVDLLRNDLARLIHHAGGGEVRVNSLFDVETYESLLQMTSTVEARFADSRAAADLRLHDVFHALFPCGSVTGAPKIRTMEIIADLEKEERGVYTGAIGYLAPDAGMVFNVPIRTVVLRGDYGEMGIGSGIIHDSDPEQEWRECLLKGRFLSHCRPRYELLETMLWRPDSGYWLLEEHLARLARSAGHFYFSCPESRVREELQEMAGSFGKSCMRVRLSLAKDGSSNISVSPCSPPELLRLPEIPRDLRQELPRVGFSDRFMEKDSGWLRHKTTRREVYDAELEAARQKGLFDVLFVNEAGEVTEGSFTNIIILREGKYLTPHLDCGLLPGVMREHLLADKLRPLAEAVLRVEDISNAEALFVCNSVRGLVQVTLQMR
jgi:para-aminobenzoate synthetase / 4-amino-4-deoxychorismate lyase